MVLRKMIGCVVLCRAAPSSFAESEPTISSFTGKWLVSNVVDYAEVSGGIPEAKNLLGKYLIISRNKINFDDESCRPKNGFIVSLVDADEELAHYYGLIYRPGTGLLDKAFLLRSSNCLPVFMIDDQSIVFGWHGVILRAFK